MPATNEDMYLARRERQERLSAARATCQEARTIHLELADRYARQRDPMAPAPAEPSLSIRPPALRMQLA